MQDDIHSLKDRVTKNEKDLVHFKHFEKLTQDWQLRTSNILDLVQSDVGQLRKQQTEFKEMLAEVEKMRNKFDEQQALKNKKAQFMDRKRTHSTLSHFHRHYLDEGHAEAAWLGPDSDPGEV